MSVNTERMLCLLIHQRIDELLTVETVKSILRKFVMMEIRIALMDALHHVGLKICMFVLEVI